MAVDWTWQGDAMKGDKISRDENEVGILLCAFSCLLNCVPRASLK